MVDDRNEAVEAAACRLRAEMEKLEQIAAPDERRRQQIAAALCQLQFAVDLLDQPEVSDA